MGDARQASIAVDDNVAVHGEGQADEHNREGWRRGRKVSRVQ